MKHIAEWLQEAFAERMAQAEVDQRQALAGKVAQGRQS